MCGLNRMTWGLPTPHRPDGDSFTAADPGFSRVEASGQLALFDLPDERRCAHCGAAFAQRVTGRGRRPGFCSEHCRHARAAAQKRAARKRKALAGACLACGKQLEAKVERTRGRKPRFCSVECKRRRKGTLKRFRMSARFVGMSR